MRKNNKKLNNGKIILTSRRAFTLVEVLVAMGIFVIVMAGSAGVFASAFKSYKGAKNVNENVKNAQYAMNLMAKIFRTSSVNSPAGINQPGTTVIVYDYSQGVGVNPGLCIRFRFSAGVLDKATANTTYNGCTGGTSFTNTTTMTTGVVGGRFQSTDSVGDGGTGTGASTIVGRVTVTMDITSGAGSSEASSARLQTTSSLRDYEISNVGMDPNNDPN